MADFLALDVETANSDPGSICSVGIAAFENGALAGEWYSLVNPGGPFSSFNVSIHGIGRADVRDAPPLAEALAEVGRRVGGRLVVTHTAFDRGSLARAASGASVAMPDCDWLDSSLVARRVWPRFSRSGYNLANVCRTIGYEFEHHNALEDAKAAGHVVLAAMRESGLDLDGILAAAGGSPARPGSWPPSRPRTPSAPIARAGKPGGPLAGEAVVFTGALRVPRREAARLAAEAGCAVEARVSASTTILVAANAGARSAKMLRARELAAAGQALRIIDEGEFLRLVGAA